MDWTTEIGQSDFQGELKLPLTSQDITTLGIITNEIVPIYMRDMLGIDEYNLFVAYMESKTEETFEENEDYEILWSGGEYTRDSQKNIFEGSKKMCIYFIWEKMFASGMNTTEGNYKNSMSNSVKASAIEDENKRTLMYNKGISIYNNAYNLVTNGNYTVQYKTKETTWLY